MATDMEMRHRERDLLFRLLKAKELGSYDDVISEIITQMEKEDVEVVKQQMNEWKKLRRS